MPDKPTDPQRFAPTPPEGGPGVRPRSPFGPGGSAKTGERLDDQEQQDLDVDDPRPDGDGDAE